MGFDISSLFAGGIEGIFKGAREIISAFKIDPTIAAGHAARLAELENALITAQLQAEVALSQAQSKVNEAEAAGGGAFARNWRPAIGWICGGGLAYTFLVQPFVAWGSTNFHWVAPPLLNIDALMTLLFGMLGLGVQRSFDKSRGTTK
jgi:hypothetical protein